MSGPVLYPWACGHVSVFCGILLFISSPLLAAGNKNNKKNCVAVVLCGDWSEIQRSAFLRNAEGFLQELRNRPTPLSDSDWSRFFPVFGVWGWGECGPAGGMILQMQTFRVPKWRKWLTLFAPSANVSS